MEERVTETAAEIEKLLITSINNLFTEIILPYYGKITSDGVRLGPSWWSTKLETQGIIMSPKAIQSREARWRESRRSETISEDTSSVVREASIRSARSAIKKHPDLVKKLLQDQEVRDVVEKEISQDSLATARVIQEHSKNHPKSYRRIDRGSLDVVTSASEFESAVNRIHEVIPNIIADYESGILGSIENHIKGLIKKLGNDTEFIRIAFESTETIDEALGRWTE